MQENGLIRKLMQCVFIMSHAAFSEYTICNCLYVKELLPWNRRDIWNETDCKEIRIHNHLFRELTLNHLAKFKISKF